MRGLKARLGALLAVGMAAGLMTAGGASAASSTHYTGTLPDGTIWIADVPSNWNGTLILYSHGFGPLVAADAPDPVTQAALLADGYALAGSSYNPNGPWWALGSALTDQFATLTTVERLLPQGLHDVYAFGTSMGGLVSALEDQNSNGRINGALTTCGIVAGENVMNQYQLDGEYAINALLAPGEQIKLTNFVDGPAQGFADGFQTAAQLTAAAQAAQTTAQGRARLALAMAFLNVSPWGDATQPSVYDYAGQEQGQYDDYFVDSSGGLTGMQFIEIARGQLEAAAGGESAGTVGVDFAHLLYHSSYYPEVKALYNEAGLNLQADLATLASGASLRSDPAAYVWNERTSVPTGQLQVPELDLKTISDQLVPVQQESYYHGLVVRAGSDSLLRQAFVAAQGHCNFTPAELVAGVQALAARVGSGNWGNSTSAASLNAAANALPTNLGGGAFIPFWPSEVTGVSSPFDTFPVQFGEPGPGSFGLSTGRGD
ncbi:MAG: alpha/beta hydrolase [Solirubrobacteraceae bacterium]|jgi:hypothetical protein